jgi:diguanylate cyclase (GGDEF)-like protein
MDSNAAVTARPDSGGLAVRPSALLPRTAELRPLGRWLVYLCVAALVAAPVVDVLHVVFGLVPSWDGAFTGPVVAGSDVVAAALVVAGAAKARRSRVVWWLLAVGISSYAIGGVLWNCWLQYLPHPPNPSIADGFWMAMYPLVGTAVVISAREQSRQMASKLMLIDGLVATTAALALCAAFIAPPLLNGTSHDQGAVVTDLVYPVADMAIGIVVVGLMSVRGWRLNRTLALLIPVFPVWLLGDSTWVVQISNSALTGSSAVTLCFLTAFALLACAAWQSGSRRPDHAHAAAGASIGTAPPTSAVPTMLGLIPPAILLYDHFSRISLTALILTWVALLTAILRIAIAMRDTMVLGDAQRAAMTDELTGLPNRRMFLTRLQEQVDVIQRSRGTLTALMLDLDNFKQLNDTLGHEAGDELLRLAGPRLTSAVRAGDLVARLGGDEFAILLPNCTQKRAAGVAQTVLDSFNEPLDVHGLTMRLTASIGIASSPGDANSAETLLRCADVAMYEAKRSRQGWAHYSPDRDANTRERLKLSGELGQALEQGEIEVMYQPIADTWSGRIVAAEALVRWRKTDGLLHPPSEFLEAVELSGLSRPLTRRVLSLTLAELRDWRAAGYNIDATVNASVADLLDLSFPDEVATVLEAHELPADALTIEVTESSILADPERVGVVLANLRELGVKIALDDFGTGYSSLTHLRRLPIDLVKIDRSFVFHMCDQPADAAIVHATIELAHRLGLHVVAEGVEDDQSWEAIRELGGERIQGYGLSRPLQPARFRRLLKERHTAPRHGPPLDASQDRHMANGQERHLAESQSLPMPASTANGGSIS